MPTPAWFDILRMFFDVHIHGSFQSELTILNNDRVLVLSNAVDGSIKRPVEDDARGFAAKSRIIFALEIRRRLRSQFRQFRSAIKTWSPRCAPTTGTTGVGSAFASL